MRWWSRIAFERARRQREATRAAFEARPAAGTRRRPVFSDPFLESECRDPKRHAAIMDSLARQVDALPGSTHTR